jgi:hypothetical protein
MDLPYAGNVASYGGLEKYFVSWGAYYSGMECYEVEAPAYQRLAFGPTQALEEAPRA